MKKLTTKKFLVLLAATLIAFSFTIVVKKISTRDILLEYIDTTANPGKDFFKYANGTWLKNHPIPSSEKGWGIWSEVQNETYDRLHEISIYAMLQSGKNAGSEQLIGDFWFSGMDTMTIEAQGKSLLQPDLDRIASIKKLDDLRHIIARFQTFGMGPAFSMFPTQDEMHSDQMSLHFYQGGLGLPDRDYYFNTDNRTKNIREEYLKHNSKMLQLLGEDVATADANSAAVFAMETELAKISRKLEDLRDPYTNYNKMSLADFNKMVPNLGIAAMLTEMDVPHQDSVIVGQPEFYKQLNKTLKKTKIGVWKEYLKIQLIETYAPYMSKVFEQESFNFNGKIMGGVKEQRPRWKRILDEEEGYLGDALGQLYVSKYFSPSTKKRYEKLVEEIFDAYRERIKGLDWMSEATKKQALDKLNSVTKKIGYPDKWRDYSSMKISRASFLVNAMEGNKWHYYYQINKLNKPVDRTEWDMTPQTYNAYYNPSNNEIVLPAAIFIIPGIADSLVDDAVIYGYAGASTIGHEITHGFDDQGRQFDKYGNLNNWWTDADTAQFNHRSQMLVDEFNNFVVLDSMHVNGSATLGENLADLGGVNLGLAAFMKTEQYKKGEKISGLTPTQRFFLGYGISWAGMYRDATIARRIMTDVHSPNFLRVNGPVVNLDEFFAAFNIKQGDAMWVEPNKRVHVW